jgi:hypothetical protein
MAVGESGEMLLVAFFAVPAGPWAVALLYLFGTTVLAGFPELLTRQGHSERV